MTLTLLRNTIDADLSAASPVAMPLGEPVAQTRAYIVKCTNQVETGTWECTPGRWRRQIIEREFYHFLQDYCTFTPDGGETIRIEAGDALLLPENSLDVWDVRETVRKSYVVIRRQPTRYGDVTRSARSAPRHP